MRKSEEEVFLEVEKRQRGGQEAAERRIYQLGRAVEGCGRVREAVVVSQPLFFLG